MFIQKITVKNFRIFPSESEFVIDEINTPDGTNEGSDLNVFVGENGSGKTALMDAFSLPILEYKTENFGIDKRLVRINTLFQDSEKYRHPWELPEAPSFHRFIH